MNKNTGKQYMYTSFRNGGRKAGYGINHDDYSEDSGNPCYDTKRFPVHFVSDWQKTEDLNGPVIIVQEGKKKDGVQESENT